MNERQAFFDDIYAQSGGDGDLVPWADMHPKGRLLEWLDGRNGQGRRAVDIACGLGDNAEALANAGYATTAFDLSAEAIDWARRRFPQSAVEYRVADLFDPPDDWLGAFDLVFECYTLQALPPERLPQTAAAVAALAAPRSTLLVYAIRRPDDRPADGPPWPVRESDCMVFADLGFELVDRDDFAIERRGRAVAHIFAEWRKTGG